MPPITYQNVITCLVERVPEFKETYTRELAFDDGEVLPHIQFGALVRFVSDVCQNTISSERQRDILKRILNFIEDAADSGDKDVVDLVVLSFLLHIMKPSFTCHRRDIVRSQFGPKTRELLKMIEHEKAQFTAEPPGNLSHS